MTHFHYLIRNQVVAAWTMIGGLPSIAFESFKQTARVTG
jgi:hypothetical protein